MTGFSEFERERLSRLLGTEQLKRRMAENHSLSDFSDFEQKSGDDPPDDVFSRWWCL